MKGEFGRVVARICNQIYRGERDGKIRAKDIPSILSNSLGGGNWDVNCYPGEPSHACHNIAYFFSLSAPDVIDKKRGHLKFEDAIEKLIQHMQGHCTGITKYAVLVTDSWNARVAYAWSRNIKEIKENCHLEIYLINKSGPTLIYI